MEKVLKKSRRQVSNKEDAGISGSGKSSLAFGILRLAILKREVDRILADAGYCSSPKGADVWVRVNFQSFVAYLAIGRQMVLLSPPRTLSKQGHMANGELSCMVKTPRFRAGCARYGKSARLIQQAHRRLERKSLKKRISTRPGTLECAKYVPVFTTRFRGSTAEILELCRGR